MPGSYQDFTRPGKDEVTGDQIANGAIDIRHLTAGLFQEIRRIAQHRHTGVGSIKIQLGDLEGSFTKDGFVMRSPNGNKWRITVDNAGTIAATAI